MRRGRVGHRSAAMRGSIAAGGGRAAVVASVALACVLAGGVAKAAPRAAIDTRHQGIGLEAARGDTTTALPDSTAAADSLAAFWRGVDSGWFDRMDDRARDFGLDAAALDSLTAAGDAKLDALAAGELWEFDWDLLGFNTFNRVQGATLGLGVKVGIAGPHRPELQVGGGYRFGTKRPLGEAKLDWPLVVRHRWLPRGMGRGRPYELLRFEADGYVKVRAFGGDGRRGLRALTAAIYGADPNQYYEARGGRLRLHLDTGRRLRLYAGVRWEEHRRLAVTTDGNVFGQDLDPPANLPAANLRDRAIQTGMAYRTRGGWLEARASAGWHRVDQSPWLEHLPGIPRRADFQRIAGHVTIDHLTASGHRLLLAGHYRAVDRRAPLQWKTYLGDHNTLRGYPHAALVGDRGAWASLDLRWNFDLWRALHVPLLRGLRLQPLLFADWGRTWDHTGHAPSLGEQDWRMDAGFGFGKLLGVPGMRGNLRLYVARPVLDGIGRDWRVLLAFEN